MKTCSSFTEPPTPCGTLFRGYVEYFTSTVVTGDYNGDGKVDAGDYTVWRDTFGKPVPQGTGADGNNNSQIDPGDYTIWKNNFGNPGSGGGQLASESQVPEPSTLLLAAVVLGWGASFQRRRGVE